MLEWCLRFVYPTIYTSVFFFFFNEAVRVLLCTWHLLDLVVDLFHFARYSRICIYVKEQLFNGHKA